MIKRNQKWRYKKFKTGNFKIELQNWGSNLNDKVLDCNFKT